MKPATRDALALILRSPYFVLLGLLVLLRGLYHLPRRLRAARAALGSELRCPAGHRVPMAARWSCSSCGASYLGSPAACAICGAGADYVVCDCGLAIPLPWEER